MHGMRPNFPSLEEFLKRLGDEPGWGRKYLIGGLLAFVPGLNIFTLGYLLQYARGIRRNGDLDLPEWTEWSALFRDGLKMLVIWLVFHVLPTSVGALFCFSFHAAAGSGFWASVLTWFLFGAGWLAGGYLYMAALYRYVVLGTFESLLDLKTIWRMAFYMRWQLALPILVYTGLLALFWPVYGLAFFMGFLILTAYSTLNYMLMERAAGINI